MKKLILILLGVFLISCFDTNKQVKNTFNGNWYSHGTPKPDDSSIDYTEIFFHNDTIYICSEYMGILSPKKYVVSKDSMFFHPILESNFIGNILMKSKDSFSLGVKGVGKRNYYRIKDSTNLENVIEGKITEENYYIKFHERMNTNYNKFNLE